MSQIFHQPKPIKSPALIQWQQNTQAAMAVYPLCTWHGIDWYVISLNQDVAGAVATSLPITYRPHQRT
jgi:hypothetical protein